MHPRKVALAGVPLPKGTARGHKVGFVFAGLAGRQVRSSVIHVYGSTARGVAKQIPAGGGLPDVGVSRP